MDLQEKTQEKFKEWRKAIRALEMKAIDALHQSFEPYENKFMAAQNLSTKLIADAEGWMDQAKGSIDVFLE